ncbi:MAG TPA: menaquinone reductase multiheme cytochrome c subunit QrcA [Candidatus Sulfotelmatobacter sp.]|nr:menaquinone reductase multiheme cytochrome c subunit QrcA [Candidatus Sulfotelmatobacter sp.]
MRSRRNAIAFAVGVVVALVLGWIIFPRVLYVKKSQPVDFLHKTHAEKSGVAECSECHIIRDDGSFAGLPAMEKCAACHADKVGDSKAEALLVNNYIKPGHETPWLVYSEQPANVWFSHAIHLKRANLACTECHSTYGEADQVRPYELNRISGYSRDIWGHSMSRLRRAPHEGMKMSDCENCHEKHGVDVGCLGCHQ